MFEVSKENNLQKNNKIIHQKQAVDSRIRGICQKQAVRGSKERMNEKYFRYSSEMSDVADEVMRS